MQCKIRFFFPFFGVCPLYNTTRTTPFGTIFQAVTLLLPTIDTLLFGDQILSKSQTTCIINEAKTYF